MIPNPIKSGPEVHNKAGGIIICSCARAPLCVYPPSSMSLWEDLNKDTVIQGMGNILRVMKAAPKTFAVV